ncbi:COX assembly mitochondrial protein 2 homolog isoform X2 [Pogonomyrmex barbatus]|uniref:COX assembly mitochondrial protein n=1 Tax=Pogonomyrmex barbatus TaxID=144034 RepID=A0A6I9XL91_9HYME|nr:COX assembly mitochondrial protein 2 homolog isoform X2 [Pogonomyrmex barbatus]XP_011646687.1 COX assembly mitochondrial protein 2 homolog isoform X2 [Pogonomyrmex barbatus]
MNYKSLAVHNAACNGIFHRFQDCEKEHPYRRFLGYCEHIQREMNACIKEQREIRRRENSKLLRERLGMKKPTQQENSS